MSTVTLDVDGIKVEMKGGRKGVFYWIVFKKL